MKSGWVTKKLGEVCEEIRDRISSAEVPVSAYITTDNMLKNCAGANGASQLKRLALSLTMTITSSTGRMRKFQYERSAD